MYQIQSGACPKPRPKKNSEIGVNVIRVNKKTDHKVERVVDKQPLCSCFVLTYRAFFRYFAVK